MAEVLNCKNCGSGLSAGSLFCGSCGVPVSEGEDLGSRKINLLGESDLDSTEAERRLHTRVTTIRRIGVLQFGKVSLAFGCLVGTIAGLIYFAAILVAGNLFWAIGGFFAALLGYAVLYFLLAMLFARIYNLIAGRFGGIEIELD